MIEIIGCILLIIIGVSFICMSVMLDKLEGTCQDCIYLEKIKPLFEKLEKENKILRENAKHNDKVVDKVNWENMLLKKENQDLKKQLEDKTEDYRRMKDNFDSKVDVLTKIETQQKEFIKYLEDEIKRLKENDIYQSLQKMALATHEHILQKYKSITGVSDEKK